MNKVQPIPSVKKIRAGLLIKLVLAIMAIFPYADHLTAQNIVKGKLGERLDSLFQNEETNGFNGTVLIAQRGEVILLKGYGFANEETKKHFEPSTLIQIGSGVKDFTKTAIYQLVEQNKLKLTDRLNLFIDGLPPDKGSITIIELLNHRSGLPLGMGGDNYPLTLKEMLQRIKTEKLAFAPGTKEQYSNIGYSVLAYIIEKISGLTFDLYVQQNILKPLGLNETGTYLPKFDAARIAHGYSGMTDKGIILDMPHDAQGHLWNLRGNGGYLSTVSEMYKFYSALRSSDLIKTVAFRNDIYNPDEPFVLAGSDLISFFLFANFPKVEIETIIATNHSSYKGIKLLDKIEPVIGVPSRGRKETDGGRNADQPITDKLPDNGAGRTIGAYLKAFNSGDVNEMKKFFTERTLNSKESPSMETRLERYQTMYGNLKHLNFTGIRESSDGESWDVKLTDEMKEEVTMTFFIEKSEPYRFLGLRVMVGN